MKISAIICEYNPFHNGHKYQIDTARSQTGCDAVVALMSGNFVQRGDFALFPKNVRAKSALLNGVDLILENPSLFVLQSAEGYASAAIKTLNSLGCIDHLVFGAECDDLEILKKIANLLATETNEFKYLLAQEMSNGSSFASARGNVVGRLLGKSAKEILALPNNLLAIEYLKAMDRQSVSFTPVVIKRTGAGHHSDTTFGSIASASHIRNEFTKNPQAVIQFVPSSSYDLYAKSPFYQSGAADKAVISALCLMQTEQIASAPDISEGLENKIKAEAMQCSSLSDLADKVKSKRYAYSRIRRAILCAYLGITKTDIKTSPQYIKILNFNKTGQAVLNTAKKTATLPLAKSASPLLKNKLAMTMWRRELEYDRLYEIFAQNRL